jgi:hypothetical protein
MMFPSTPTAVFAVVVHPLSAFKSERHHALLMISTMKPDVLVEAVLPPTPANHPTTIIAVA